MIGSTTEGLKMLGLEVKDWEQVKKEATQQIKQALIMLEVNKKILGGVEDEIRKLQNTEKADKQDTATSDKTPEKGVLPTK